MVHRLFALAIVSAVALAGTGGAQAAGGPYTEQAYYHGETYTFVIPPSSSANPHQLFVGCLRLGPDMTDQRTGSVNTFYAIFLPGATQEVCLDGSLRHDHLLTTVPGVPGYSPLWHVIAVTPTPAFDPRVTVMPLTSVEEVGVAVAAGQVELSDTGITFRAAVLGRAGQ